MPASPDRPGSAGDRSTVRGSAVPLPDSSDGARMTFAHAAMVAGLLAIAIPIIIHFFNQKRFQVVKWGAMHLLKTSLQSKLKVEQLLLLLVRCAIPAILALLMARPILVNSN